MKWCVLRAVACHNIVDKRGLLRGVGNRSAAHFADVGNGGLRIITKLREGGTGEHARAADAGAAMEGYVLALSEAGCDLFGEALEGIMRGQGHVADGVVQEGDALPGTDVGLLCKAERRGLVRFEERDECGDPCGLCGLYVAGQDCGARHYCERAR